MAQAILQPARATQVRWCPLVGQTFLSACSFGRQECLPHSPRAIPNGLDVRLAAAAAFAPAVVVALAPAAAEDGEASCEAVVDPGAVGSRLVN